MVVIDIPTATQSIMLMTQNDEYIKILASTITSIRRWITVEKIINIIEKKEKINELEEV